MEKLNKYDIHNIKTALEFRIELLKKLNFPKSVINDYIETLNKLEE